MKMSRYVWRNRGYLAWATLTLATTIGLNCVVFTVVNALWLRPLAFRDAHRLVTITSHVFVDLDAPILRDFESVAGQSVTHQSLEVRARLTLDQTDRELETLGVTPNYFTLLGLPIRGRDFISSDNSQGAEAVAIVSDNLWEQEFGRRPEIVGSVVRARPLSFRVIGVAPAGFQGARRGERADIWIASNLVPRLLPMAAGAATIPPPLAVFGRTLPGQTALTMTKRLSDLNADDLHWRGLNIVPLTDVFGMPDSMAILIREGNAFAIVAGLATLIFIGGSATLAALVIVHYERRRREFAARIALGCVGWRLARELVGEMIPLFVVGVTTAILIAYLGLRVIPSASLPGGVDLSRLDLSLDWRVLGFAVAGTLAVLLLATALPVRRCAYTHAATELLNGPVATASAASQRVRQGLLGLHVCATVIVLIIAGLFVRAVLRGFSAGPGFDAGRTVFIRMRVVPPLTDSGSIEIRQRLAAERTVRAVEALRFLNGVEIVAFGTSPIGPDALAVLTRNQSVETSHGNRELLLGSLRGSPELLAALGVPILVGRRLEPADARVTPRPIVVTASLARILWPAENALGQVLTVGGRSGGPSLVVGVAQDFLFGSFARPATGVVVGTGPPASGVESQFIIRAPFSAELSRQIRQALNKELPGLPGPVITSGRDMILKDLGRQRLGAWFFSGFGTTALLLSVGGVFGLVAYLAASRQHEYGIRLALGATSRDLIMHAVAVALIPVTIGALVGLILATTISRLLVSSLVGLSGLDPITYVLVAVMVLSLATAAALTAAWRLKHVTPVDALKTT